MGAALSTTPPTGSCTERDTRGENPSAGFRGSRAPGLARQPLKPDAFVTKEASRRCTWCRSVQADRIEQLDDAQGFYGFMTTPRSIHGTERPSWTPTHILSKPPCTRPTLIYNGSGSYGEEGRFQIEQIITVLTETARALHREQSPPTYNLNYFYFHL
jgi:hypothetical protein